MRPQARTKPDDTRARIVDTADALFRRLGFAKTAVADIAAELRNVASQCLPLLPIQDRDRPGNLPALPVRGRGGCLGDCALQGAQPPSASRRLILEILAYHKENLLTEQRVNDIVLVAIEHNWDHIRAPQGRPPQRRGADLARWDRGRRIRGGRPAHNGGADLAICRGLHPSSAYRPMPAGWGGSRDRSPRIRPLSAPSHHPV